MSYAPFTRGAARVILTLDRFATIFIRYASVEDKVDENKKSTTFLTHGNLKIAREYKTRMNSARYLAQRSA